MHILAVSTKFTQLSTHVAHRFKKYYSRVHILSKQMQSCESRNEEIKDKKKKGRDAKAENATCTLNTQKLKSLR